MSLRWSYTAVFALGTLACSDPVPPPAQAGLRLGMANSAGIAGKSCPVTTVTKTVPDRDPTSVFEGPTATDPGVRVIDGEDGSKISCTVKEGSGTFSVSGSIQYASTSFTLLGGSVPEGGMGTANISVYAPEIGTSISSPSGSPCTLRVPPGTNFQVKSGSIWAEFACPSLETTPSTACSANGIVVFENCRE
jgi:hypothetical protein